MSLKLLNSLFLGMVLMFSIPLTTSAFACDDKSCETAYLAETQQHIANHVRRANTYKVERHAYSMNRERRAYAEFVHKHFMWARAKLAQVL